MLVGQIHRGIAYFQGIVQPESIAIETGKAKVNWPELKTTTIVYAFAAV